jgi:hypothetical protein
MSDDDLKPKQAEADQSKRPAAASDLKTTAAQSMHNLSPEKQALLARRLKEKRELNRNQTGAEQGLVSGPLPLIPMLMFDYVYRPPQAWWRSFEMLLEIPGVLRPAQIHAVMQHLIAHHDGLRLRLVKENDAYRMFIAASEQDAFQERDLSALPALEQDSAIEAAREELWAGLNFSTGPLFRIIFFDLGPERAPRMLIILHHFAVDAYSMGILLSDFQTAARQLLMGKPLKLPAKTTSIKQWAERVDAYVRSEAAKPEFAYWKSLPWDRVRPTPVDHPEMTKSPAGRLMGSLTPDETQTLLLKVPAAYNVRLLDVLLTACFLTYTRYTRLQPLFILVLHHGRNLTFGELDLFRTVGNLYTSYPLLLDIDPNLSVDNAGQVLKLVAEERLRVPHSGAAWHWVSHHSTEKFVSVCENMKIVPNVVFNYLGEGNPETQNPTEMFREIRKPVEKLAEYLYEVTEKAPHTCKAIVDAGQFKVYWEYFSALDERATIEKLIDDYLTILRSLIKMAG